MMNHRLMKSLAKGPVALGLIFIIFSFVLGFILKNGLIIFLSWNMILSMSVYLFSSLTVYLHKKEKNRIFIIMSLIVWILLFPNSFYILTDVIHFQQYQFFQTYPNIYLLDVYDWYVYFDIIVGALISIKIGLMSLEQIKKIIPKNLKKYQFICIIGLFFISSMGIYLGRFIRLNSWNIFDISRIFQGIFDYFDFFIVFVLLFTAIHLVTYALFKEKDEI